MATRKQEKIGETKCCLIRSRRENTLWTRGGRERCSVVDEGSKGEIQCCGGGEEGKDSVLWTRGGGEGIIVLWTRGGRMRCSVVDEGGGGDTLLCVNGVMRG